MARPKLAPDERRDAQIPPLRVTAAELHFVEEQAAVAGLSLSDYSRRLLLGQTVTPARSAADGRLIMEVNRVGVLLNQIARALNSDRPELISLEGALYEFRKLAALVTSRL